MPLGPQGPKKGLTGKAVSRLLPLPLNILSQVIPFLAILSPWA